MYMQNLKTKPPSAGRMLRIVLGVFLLGLFTYAILPGTFLAQGPSGRVNADLVTIRAPIDGQITFADPRIGERVKRGQTLAELRDIPERDVRLSNLKAQSEALIDRIASLEKQAADLEPFLRRLSGDSQSFRNAVVSNLNAQISEAEARVRQAEANAKLLEAQFRRIEPLVEKGYASRADFDRRKSEADVAQAEVAAQRKSLDRLRQERAAADQGIYLSDSYNNAPYSQQRRDEIELQRLNLANRRAELEAERAQVERQLEAEQRRRRQMGEAVITTPVDGVLWRQMESDGATIGISVPILQIADCSRIFFEVLRDRRSDEPLSIGDTAIVDFERYGRMVSHNARLVGFRGDQDGERREFAIATTPAADQLLWIFSIDFTATINADDPQLQSGQTETCPIGRIGRLHAGNSVIERIIRRLGGLFSAG
jgi:multidrug resistance efflux pump